MCLCLNSELAAIQNLLSFAFLIHRGYLPVVSCSEHNLLINFQFIDPKGNLSLLCTGYCYNKMLHKGASKIKAFYVHFNQYHFYLIYSPVLNFLAASKTKKWYCQFYRCKKITTMVTTGWQTVREKSEFFQVSEKYLFRQGNLSFFFFQGKAKEFWNQTFEATMLHTRKKLWNGNIFRFCFCFLHYFILSFWDKMIFWHCISLKYYNN